MSETEKGITLQQILEEIRINRSEIANKIDATETRLLMNLESVNERVKDLESENFQLKREIELLKRENRKNNIIIFGLDIPQNTFTVETICNKLENLLEIEVSVQDISNFYKLGKTETCPIKVEFLIPLKKDQILKNCNKLKGKTINITPDYTPQQREELKTLRHHLYLAKQNKNNTCFIKNNKLYVNGTAYKPEDLTGVDIAEADRNKPSSAPTTPTTTLIEKRGTTHIWGQTTKGENKIDGTPKKVEISTRKPSTRQNQQPQPIQDQKTRSRNIK